MLSQMIEEYKLLLEIIMEERVWVMDYAKLTFETIKELSENRNKNTPLGS